MQVSDVLHARLSRFAHCISSSSTRAYAALDKLPNSRSSDDTTQLYSAYRALLDQLREARDQGSRRTGALPRSLVARFSFLPYHQRVAFALVVIEEFTMEDAAEIMNLDANDVQSLLLATRNFLFSGNWVARGDA